MASSVPAAAIGLADVGRIAVGQLADLALWSAAMEVDGDDRRRPSHPC